MDQNYTGNSLKQKAGLAEELPNGKKGRLRVVNVLAGVAHRAGRWHLGSIRIARALVGGV